MHRVMYFSKTKKGTSVNGITPVDPGRRPEALHRDLLLNQVRDHPRSLPLVLPPSLPPGRHLHHPPSTRTCRCETDQRSAPIIIKIIAGLQAAQLHQGVRDHPEEPVHQAVVCEEDKKLFTFTGVDLMPGKGLVAFNAFPQANS